MWAAIQLFFLNFFGRYIRRVRQWSQEKAIQAGKETPYGTSTILKLNRLKEVRSDRTSDLYRQLDRVYVTTDVLNVHVLLKALYYVRMTIARKRFVDRRELNDNATLRQPRSISLLHYLVNEDGYSVNLSEFIEALDKETRALINELRVAKESTDPEGVAEARWKNYEKAVEPLFVNIEALVDKLFTAMS